jgi:serine protease Do
MPVPVPGTVAEALRRSTVQIRSEEDKAEGNGSGAILADDQVVTNAHVVRGGNLRVESWDGRTLPVSVKKLDHHRDLALLAVSGLKGTPVSLGDSDQLRAGTPVVAVGNPLGFVGAVSSGIVHSVGRAALGGYGRSPFASLSWVCADVRLAPGNSGGPLARFDGQVIGINTMVASGGLAFAVPSRAVQTFLTRSSQARSLGVTVRPVEWRQGELGMLILELAPGGAAEGASLLPGDILVAADDRRFHDLDDLSAAIDRTSGGILKLEFYRGGRDTMRQVAVQLQAERVRSAA